MMIMMMMMMMMHSYVNTGKELQMSFVQNNQLDASNIQNLFCHKTLHVSDIFCAHRQELSAVRTATVPN
jgi:hypothetical protein